MDATVSTCSCRNPLNVASNVRSNVRMCHRTSEQVLRLQQGPLPGVCNNPWSGSAAQIVAPPDRRPNRHAAVHVVWAALEVLIPEIPVRCGRCCAPRCMSTLVLCMTTELLGRLGCLGRLGRLGCLGLWDLWDLLGLLNFLVLLGLLTF